MQKQQFNTQIQENGYHYSKRRDKKIGKHPLMVHLIGSIFCSVIFSILTGFNYYSFPLFLKETPLCGMLIHSNYQSIYNAFGTVVNFEKSCDRGSVVPIVYRIIETDQDWEELVNDPRNEFETEILLAVVYNDRYLKQIKDMTLSGQWKRIPFFISAKHEQLLIRSIEDGTLEKFEKFDF